MGGGKEAGCHISFLSKQAVSSAHSGGGDGRQPGPGLGKEPLCPIFHRHPRQSLLSGALSNFLPRLPAQIPPTKRGIVSSSLPLASAPQRSVGGCTEGIWGMKAPHPPEGPQILEQKELGPGRGGPPASQPSSVPPPTANPWNSFSLGLSGKRWVRKII